MNNYLRVTLWSDGDGTAELRAEVSCNGFAGRSSACFRLPQLERFANQLLAYPLPSEGVAPLVGGYWSKERRGEIDEQHVEFKKAVEAIERGAPGPKSSIKS